MKEEPENSKEALTSKSAEPAENVTSTESSTAEDDLDLASTDEVKVYKDEGEEENRSSENLSEEKLGLVIETEEGKSSDTEGKNNYSADENSNGPSHGPKMQKCSFFDRLPFGYPLLPPYPPYPSGSPLVVSHGDLFPPTPGLGFYMYNDHPPPAHMGIQPLHIDPKTGLPRTPFYGLSTSPGHPPLYTTDLPQMHSLDLVSRTSPASSLCGSYTSNLTAPSLAWLGASGILPPPPPPGFSYHGFNSAQSLVTSSALKQELSPRSEPSMDDIRDSRLKSTSSSSHHHQSHQRFSVHGNPVGGGMNGVGHQEKKRPYVKKPLNAYMLFMKEMRQSVIEECTLKESAAINQILGRKWHALDKAEQQKYYDMAKREKELHLQMYPGWSARDNYATHTKKKKRKKESTTSSLLTSQELQAGRRSGSNGSHIQNHINSTNKNSFAVHSHFEGPRNPFENPFDSFIHGNCGFSSDHSIISEGSCPNGQKCRSRYGLSQRHNWCKDCRNEGLEQSKYAEEERDMPPEQSIVCLSQPNIPRSKVSL